jgi:hypothetical protein
VTSEDRRNLPGVPTDLWLTDTRTSYDTVATSYADVVRDSLAHDRYLRGALALFADLAGDGPVVDVGCGPGHVTAHLNGLGVHVGDGSTLKTEGYGSHPMNVHVHRRRPDRVAGWLRDVGFTVEAQLLLDPDEKPSALLFARL